MTKEKRKNPYEAQKYVDAYHDAKGALTDFMSDPENAPTLQELGRLMAASNEALGEAVREVKAELKLRGDLKVNLDGIGVTRKTKNTYNGDLLRELLDDDETIAEVIKVTVTNKVIPSVFTQMVRHGDIGTDIAEQVHSSSYAEPSLIAGSPKPVTLEEMVDITDEYE